MLDLDSVDTFSEDNKKNLQCGYCKNLLSVPGITVPDSKNNFYACGRCSNTKGSRIPAVAYETIASLVKFPCRYATDGCNKKLFMEAVFDHERACKHRIYKCIATNCNWIGTSSVLKTHTINCHSNITLKDGSFKLPLDDITSLYIIYMYDEIYLLKVDVKDLIFHLSVKYVGKPPECGRFTYEVEVKKTGSKQQSSIKLYSGKMKCYNDFEGLNEKVDVDFDIKSLDGIFKTRKVECFINIAENTPKKVKLTKPKAAIFEEFKSNEAVGSSDISDIQKIDTDKKVSKKKLAPKSLNEHQTKYNNQNDDMIRELECPICHEYMSPPIMICASGHSICSDCKSKLNKCPTCSSKYGNTRNYALESMLNLVHLPCRNDMNGCEFVGNFAAIQEHKADCKYAEFECPLSLNCKWVGVGPTNLVENHLNRKHSDKFIELDTHFSYSLNLRENEHHLIRYKQELFRVSFKRSKTMNGLAQWSFQQLYKRWPPIDYKIEISFQDGTNARRKFIINDSVSELTDFDSIFNDSLVIPLNLLKPFIDAENNLCLIYTIS